VKLEVFETEFVEKINTHILRSIKFFISEKRAVFEIMRKKYVRARKTTDENITRRMRFACWITKATCTQNI
jgi:hypothetical protein